MHTKEKKDIDEKTKEYLILLAGCVCKGYWEQQEILKELMYEINAASKEKMV